MKRYFILGLLSAGLIVLITVSGGVWNDFFRPPEAIPPEVGPPDTGPRATGPREMPVPREPSAAVPRTATSSVVGDESSHGAIPKDPPVMTAEPAIAEVGASSLDENDFPSAEDEPSSMEPAPQPIEDPPSSVEAVPLPIEDEPLPGPDDAQQQPAPSGHEIAPLPAPVGLETPTAPPKRVLAGNRVLVFWEPFLTELQARRFATLLSERSGVDVRAEGERREHRVAFDFRDENDLNAKIGRIESSTTFDIRSTYFQRIYLLSEELLPEELLPEENTVSREDAEARANEIRRVTGMNILVVNTADEFVLGIGYTQEVGLMNAIQIIESLSSPDEPANTSTDESKTRSKGE